MSRRVVSALLLLIAASPVGCRKKEEPLPEKPAPAASASSPRVLYLPDDFDAEKPAAPRLEPPAKRRCPSEMVLVEDAYCVDRYESSFVVQSSSGDLAPRYLSPHYPPTKHYSNLLFDRFKKQPARPAKGAPALLDVPPPPDFQRDADFEPRAVSEKDRLPAGYLTRDWAELACQNAGKRLCSREEWTRACRGSQNRQYPYGSEYREGLCNVHRKSHPANILHGDASRNHLDPRLGLTRDDDGPLLRTTGATSTCRSEWGDDAIYDMVGNLDEWIDDPGGSFLGGFYSRGTTAGCAASIDSHEPSYFDYSLGTRCCSGPSD